MTRFFLLLSVLFITVTASAQQTLSAQAFRTVNVRTGPGTRYEIAGQIASGAVVTVTGRSDAESNWLRIDFAGGEGWVAFFTVTLDGSAELLPIVEAHLSAAAAPFDPDQGSTPALRASSEVYATAFRRVNVRSGPATSYERVGSLDPGDTVDITGRTADQEWLLIDYQGTPGWVAYFVVSVTGELDAVTIVATTPQIADLEADLAAATVSITIITRFNTNLRAQPDFGADVVAIVPFNTPLEVQARTEDSLWLRVRYDGVTGWLMTALINVTSGQNIEVLPVDVPNA
ncbi:MAG: SH3 domain-containing protein [Anaerolinea sp.]|nr:SH3 domain-containing protein [Anaerolinea sp.]